MENLPESASKGSILRHVCERCQLRDICLPASLLDGSLLELRRHIQRLGPIKAGEHLFRRGDRFHFIYAVRSGCLETYRSTRSGRKEVLGFHLAGELLGLDAIYAQAHRCDAVALDESVICALPYFKLMEFARDQPMLYEELIRLMSNQISHQVLLLAGHNAGSRIAVFLLDVMQRRKAHGDQYDPLVLPMSREDIASHLHIATETVSRAITRLEAEGVIAANSKIIHLLNAERLAEIAKE